MSEHALSDYVDTLHPHHGAAIEYREMQDDIRKLKQQRDALLAALKRAEDALVIHAGHRAASVADIRSAIAAVATVESGK